MAKELTHRAGELKELGWSNDDVQRYAELWDYRQRWGAINLEREDRLFLKKAEAALPKIVSGKAAAKKPTNEKSYYRWLRFYLDEMDKAENAFGLEAGSRGTWPILLEEELRAIDYYQPVLGLPDTIKAKGLDSFREDIIKRTSEISANNIKLQNFDFHAPIEALKAKEKTSWRPLREGIAEDLNAYPVLTGSAVNEFRQEVRNKISRLIPETLPSLAETDKPNLPDNWTPD